MGVLTRAGLERLASTRVSTGSLFFKAYALKHKNKPNAASNTVNVPRSPEGGVF